MSKEKIVLTFKVGDSEVQLEGSRKNILKMVEEDIPKIVKATLNAQEFYAAKMREVTFYASPRTRNFKKATLRTGF